MMLELKSVDAYYGRAHILSDISLTVARGEVVALLGRNGAGKSTTLKTVIGIVRPARGQVLFQGREINRLSLHEIPRLGVGYVPEERRVFAELTVSENLVVGRRARRPETPWWDEARLFGLFPKLEELRDQRAGTLSGGEQQMLTIARTLMGNPALLLLDEPSEGLAPMVVQQMAAAVRQLKSEGLSILLSEQNLAFALGIGDRAVVIEKGSVRYQGTMAALAADEDVRRTYLSV